MQIVVLGVFIIDALVMGGKGVGVSPDDQVVEDTLSLPYVFYNESFGFARGYATAWASGPGPRVL